uniref:Uncharacterized protein n=1 Tax=Setaria italica TaxID=4555 RepID=K3ZFM3_SETIT
MGCNWPPTISERTSQQKNLPKQEERSFQEP